MNRRSGCGAGRHRLVTSPQAASLYVVPRKAISFDNLRDNAAGSPGIGTARSNPGTRDAVSCR